MQYALDLSQAERNLVKDLQFLASTIPGTQQIRLDIGHALFGARVEFGDPLFVTISPSTRHSSFAIRVSRYRHLDPAIIYNTDSILSGSRWHERTHPKLLANEDDEKIEVPNYECRRRIIAKDPLAAMMNFTHSTKFLLPRLLGCRMQQLLFCICLNT